MTLQDLIADAELTASEAKVADFVGRHPERIAFGTVASVADEAGTSKPTVVRAANALGFDGFSQLQDAVRNELGSRLGAAAERIRSQTDSDAVAIETANVVRSLGAMDDATRRQIASVLSKCGRIVVLAGDATVGVARIFADQLSALRDGVTLVEAVPARSVRETAVLTASDACVAIDVHRYEHAVTRSVESAHEAGAYVVAITDSVISPLAAGASATVVVSAEGVGPFDSHVGTLAVCNSLAAAVADRIRKRATPRLERIEKAWSDRGVLSD